MRHPVRRLAAVAVVGLLAGAGVAVATGRVAYVVTRGVSMHPVYKAGDLVVLARSHSYHLGQIAAYHHGAEGPVVLHRIIGGDSSGYVFKGDNNESLDIDHPGSGQLIGRAVLHVPKVGRLVQSPVARGVVVLGVVLVAYACRRRTAPRTAERVAPRSRLLVLLLGADVILVVALGLSFTMVAPASIPSGSKALTQTGELRYHAGIDPSDTYPLGAVDTGDPVYLRLLKAVDVAFRYRTDAPPDSVTGTGRMDIEVSSADGWHTRLPLAAPTPLAAGRLDLIGTLDVAPIQAIAAGVAKAAGINTSMLDIAVTASVAARLHGAAPVEYITRIPFKMSSLALTLSGVRPTPSEQGPVIASTAALGAPPAPATAESRSSLNPRTVIAIGLLLAVGSTVLVWPSPEKPVDATADPVLRRTRAANIHLPASVSRVELTDPSALETLARDLGCPVVAGDDGWQGVLARDVVYWARSRPPPAPTTDASSAPVPPALAGWQSPLLGIGLGLAQVRDPAVTEPAASRTNAVQGRAGDVAGP